MATSDDINNTLQNISRQLGANTATTTFNNVTINNATINSSTLNSAILNQPFLTPPVLIWDRMFPMVTIDGATSSIQDVADPSSVWNFSQIGVGDNSFASGLVFAKTRNTSPSPGVIVQNGDGIGGFFAYGDDGTNYSLAGGVTYNVNGTPSAGNIPARLSFFDRSFNPIAYLDVNGFQEAQGSNTNVLAFGADPTGAADSAAAFQAAIDALPASGGDVIIPGGTYKINSTINIGNGSSSAVSSRFGIHLRGRGGPQFFWFGSSAWASAVRLVWGGSGGTMVQVNGPLQGWGLHNIFLDGASSGVPDYGLRLFSASVGLCTNISISGCAVSGLSSEAFDPWTGNGSFGSSGSFGNTYINTFVRVPDANFAKGIKLMGGGTTTVTTDTAFNIFHNVFIVLTGGGGNTNYGMLLEVCDSNVIVNLHTQMNGTNNFAVKLDYTVDSAYPNSNDFYHVVNDVVAGATEWSQDGSPGFPQPNGVFGISRTNGGAAPTISGFYCYETIINQTLMVAVADLPASANNGSRAFVSDATSTTFASVVAGGGGNRVPVYWGGSNWRIG